MASCGRFVRILSWVQVAGLASVVALFATSAGCDSRIGNGSVSTSTFASLALTDDPEQDPIQLVTDKVDLLKAILPTQVEAALDDQASVSFPLGTLPLAAGGQDALLVYEANLRAICSIELCASGVCLQEKQVTLHYDDVGFATEMESAGANFPTLSQTVPSISVSVSRGAGLGSDPWVIAYETETRSLVAMRARDVGYRPLEDDTDIDNANFGRGNGLVLSTVITGAEMQAQLGLGIQPRLTRIFDLGPASGSNKHRLLVFFAREVLQEVHLIELETSQERTQTILGAGGAFEDVWMLRGEIKKFGTNLDEPFVAFSEIKELTQEEDVIIGNFQPTKIYSDGSALVFDEVSTQFIKLTPLSALDALDLGKAEGQGQVSLAVDKSMIDAEIGSRGTLEFSESWGHPTLTEIVLVEERSNSLLSYDFTLSAEEDNVRTIVNTIDLTSNRRDPNPPSGGIVVNTEEPILLRAEEDIFENRLMFDRGRDELISINYDTGSVVIVAKRPAFTAMTGGDLTDITYIKHTGVEPGDLQSVRVWDSSTSSLLKVLLKTKLEPTNRN
ncbi:MAG: hypothetical protein VYD81_02095 [Planctomycetota bacterium]|nr:hypothetical protein [Planctomycetota bacterium]